MHAHQFQGLLWIPNHLAPDVGTTIRQHHLTDLTYASDAAVFMSEETQAASTLQSFNTIAFLSVLHKVRVN